MGQNDGKTSLVNVIAVTLLDEDLNLIPTVAIIGVIMMDMFWALYFHIGGCSEDMILTVSSCPCLKAYNDMLKNKAGMREKLIRQFQACYTLQV